MAYGLLKCLQWKIKEQRGLVNPLSKPNSPSGGLTQLHNAFGLPLGSKKPVPGAWGAINVPVVIPER